jgi:membrane associated rhomboid family serine protease
MPRGFGDGPAIGLPRPGPALRGVLIALGAVWLAFALGINWAGAPESLFYALAGSTERILSGEIWRLFTAPFLHIPSGSISHILMTLLGLYFLAPSLESRWGPGRFLRFLALSAIFAYGFQMLLELALPASLGGRLVPTYWFGAEPVVSAVSVAWALSFRGRSVNLMFVLPVTSRGLIIFVLAVNVMYLIAGAGGPDGLLAPFGGMLAGWLFGGSSPSPLRRLWLRLKLAQLDAEARREAASKKKRRNESGFQVIDGGKTDDEPGPESGDGGKPGPNGRWLN